MVNKRDVEVFIIYLSCHFGIGKLPYHRGKGTPVEILYHTIILTMTKISLFPEFSNIWCRHSFSRDMRHSTYILSRALLIFAFTLTVNHFMMLMIGAMGA
jgi:hypothetical protein